MPSIQTLPGGFYLLSLLYFTLIPGEGPTEPIEKEVLQTIWGRRGEASTSKAMLKIVNLVVFWLFFDVLKLNLPFL